MKVVLSTLGKFHTFELAREMAARNALGAIFTGYPRFKLKQESTAQEQIHSFPWFVTPYMALTSRGLLRGRLKREWEYLNCASLDRYTARHMPECDVFVGLSSTAVLSGQAAQRLGARYICDRGSAHIREQENLLRDEHDRWGMPYCGIDPRIIEREEAEYASADCITVPSLFAVQSFRAQGIPEHKLRCLPYGVNLDNFYPDGQPDPTRFDVLFTGNVSLQKGIPDLLRAFQQLQHPNKKLSIAGSYAPEFIEAMKKVGLWGDDVSLLGHLNWTQLRQRMSRSHVMVLPSIQDGFGMVLTQALACGCPIIGTEHTGAPDLINSGKAGFIVPIRAPDAITARLQHLADRPEERRRLSQEATALVNGIGGWTTYGEKAFNIYMDLL